MEGSSEPGLADSRFLQVVATAPAISGDFPENGEHGMPDSVGQSWDVIWCQPFCGHWGQHPDLTAPWGGGGEQSGPVCPALARGWAQVLSSPATPLLNRVGSSPCQIRLFREAPCTKPSSGQSRRRTLPPPSVRLRTHRPLSCSTGTASYGGASWQVICDIEQL